MTIPGTLRCERIKTSRYAACACGWSVPPRPTSRRARLEFQAHIRLVRASLQQRTAA